MIEFEGLDKLGTVGVLVVIVGWMGKLIWQLVNKQNEPDQKQEAQIRNDSRDKIMATYEIVRDVQERQKNRDKAFFEMKGETSEIHEVITEKIDGTPIIYQPRIDIAVRDIKAILHSMEELLSDVKETGRADHKRLGKIESSLDVFKDLYTK